MRDPQFEQDEQDDLNDPGSTSNLVDPYTDFAGTSALRKTGFDPYGLDFAKAERQARRDAANAILGKLYAASPRAPQGMTKHKQVSLLKSAIRIIGYALGALAVGATAVLPNRLAASAFIVLIVSELLGVIEEQFEHE